ncbi:hypothetical protein HF086_010528 [Spodoptera exigua]|uniref:Uncharacterized protein n=1 Tax=Spodoptera exigua TaxID=7107 RepID=A0A922MVI4_SPOEX|nr:hypothetical protein HF086_010528 [Spodoptera exigua]
MCPSGGRRQNTSDPQQLTLGCVNWYSSVLTERVFSIGYPFVQENSYTSLPDGDNGSTHALYLETIVEETSDDLRSERSSAATWLSDSDADSVIHVRGTQASRSSSLWRDLVQRPPHQASRPTPWSHLRLPHRQHVFQHHAPICLPRTSAKTAATASGRGGRPRRRRAARPKIAHRAAAGSAPCLVASPSAERRPPRAARALSLPAELDVCAEPRRHAAHRARFRQTFEVSDSLTVSVADLTALDYRGGPRRPRLPPPPPPPRMNRNVPPPPPPVEKVVRQPTESPVREPSASSDSTTESERAFAREMEATARRLDETARRALADSENYDRELSVMTARRLHDSWGAWDDVLDELRRRIDGPSPSPSPPRTPSPDPIREPVFTSTPLRSSCDARVRSTPELRSRATPHRETPEELRASLQLVAPPPPDAAPPVRSVSAGSKGVTFSPVVAEVSWRETSTSTTESETTASDDADDAEVVVVEGEGAEFSGRKEKKTRGAGANIRPPTNGTATAADAGQVPRGPAAGPQYVRIPLKEEGVSRAAAPPVAGGVAHKPPRPRPPPAPPAGVLETDVDTQRTVLHARSLLALAPPDQRTPRPHKSMEFLLDKDNVQTVQRPLSPEGHYDTMRVVSHAIHLNRAEVKVHTSARCRRALHARCIRRNNSGGRAYIYQTVSPAAGDEYPQHGVH